MQPPESEICGGCFLHRVPRAASWSLPASQPARPAMPFPELRRPLRTGLDGVAEGRMQNCPCAISCSGSGLFFAVTG